MTQRSVPVQRRDRPWLTSHVAYLIGPLEIPGVDDLRATLRRLIAAHPDSRLDWRLDADGHWRPGASPDALVVEGTWDDGCAPGELMDAWRAHSALPHPLAIVRFPDHLLFALSHGIGDGRVITALVEMVTRAMVSDEVGPWPAHPSGRTPLLTAAAKTFGRHPLKIRDALRDRPAVDRGAAPGARLPWTPSRRTVVTTIPGELVDEMVVRAEAVSPEASRFALITAVVLRALAGVGLDIAADVTVMTDLRRYLRAGMIDGNFIAGVPMRLDADVSPQDFSAMLRRTMCSGRPLANQMLSSLRAGGRRRSVQPPAWMDPQALPRVTVSDLGRMPTRNLPFLQGHSVLCAASAVPDGPHGITFAFAHTPNSVVITAAFDDAGVDSARLELALKAVATDPSALLFGPRGRR
ncbi:hypothetical protein BCA37_20845 [Mycobacterium sp. djl-10]|nr:hypothetical protein BCA37_20845 [Mycobacterium sp. djl-10]